ncbi:MULTISPECIES: hypothetical protein [Prosthecochloris]|uniref:Uncharacterized protein n=1 Tax=Prosthecochloris vibrioformis TaxID=1098 RepID=A0A5C4S2X2_PROVB|nr:MULTISPECIES: hypothetical protein [Prosthecochloris]ANT65797.1 hypothetical protein Ptc2401_02067 [Prosthecochloris sp. CIB 2401]TNJ37833.1 hypothetical protein FGF68_01250 [Prosthecochloris vibrioformis]
MPGKKIIPELGRTTGLRSFQAALLAYDGTLIFCDRFFEKGTALAGTMVGCALDTVRQISGSLLHEAQKAGRQKPARKLLLRAKSSLGLLQGYYEDYLATQGDTLWDPEEHEAIVVSRRLHGVAFRPDRADFFAFSELSAGKFANTQICLIRNAALLLSAGEEDRCMFAPAAIPCNNEIGRQGGFDTLLC